MSLSDAWMRPLRWTLLLCILFVSGGATCARRAPVLTLPPPPPILSAAPGLDEVVAAVNRTASIRELSTNSASVDVLSMPALPKLTATINLRKEREFRFKANPPVVMTSGLDMGSNNDLFWFEVPEGFSRTLYFARHDQYQAQMNRSILPVDPTWLSDAIGLVQVDPLRVVRGPVKRPDGKLELRSTVPTASGVFQTVCYIDAQAGHVTDQYLFSPSGAKVAEAHSSNHQFYAEHNCSLPHTVQFLLAPQTGPPIEMKIDIGMYAVNQILSGDPNLFVMPQGADQVVDLSTLAPVNPSVVSPASYQSPVSYQPSEMGPLPYRGLVQ